VAIKAHIHAPTFFLPSLLFLPFLLNKQDHYIHTRAFTAGLFACSIILQDSCFGVLLTTTANPSTSFTMDAPTIQPKFLKNGSDLGIVAVGFSGGQVNTY